MNVAGLTRVRWLLGTLLIGAAALFALGVAGEGDVHHDTVALADAGEHNAATEPSGQAEANESTGHEETTESTGNPEAAGAPEPAGHDESGEASASGEEILGVNLESTPLVVLAVIVSIALAAATWRSDRKLVLLVTALFAAMFAALDVAELSHQIKESAATIAVIAGVIAVMHAAAALLAEQRRSAMP